MQRGEGTRRDRNRRASRARWALLWLLPVTALGCKHSHHTISPYRDDAAKAAQIEAEAQRVCSEQTGNLPPRKFVTDGCSAYFDGDWVECCVEHDMPYWCGGTAEDRRRADAGLADCVAERIGRPVLGEVMYLGVRVGGGPWWPADWHWGYGWDWPHRYDRPPPRDEPVVPHFRPRSCQVRPAKPRNCPPRQR